MGPRCWLGYHGVRNAPDVVGALAVMACPWCGAEVVRQHLGRWKRTERRAFLISRQNYAIHLKVEDFLEDEPVSSAPIAIDSLPSRGGRRAFWPEAQRPERASSTEPRLLEFG
jgi:hypothetical protein